MTTPFSFFKKRRDDKQIQKKRGIAFASASVFKDLCADGGGYTPLTKIPEVMTLAYRIASILASGTIHLMENREDGDRRIVNELSRAFDINPERNMTRTTWMQAVVMNLLLYGQGNSVVVPHTYKGFLQGMEPISASRVSFAPVGGSYRDYRILIDGVPKDPANLVHFKDNPDQYYMWKGQGILVALQTILDNLVQAEKTENAFLRTEYKPNVIIRVDSDTQELATPAGRQKIINDYIKTAAAGEPWMIPTDMFQVEQIRPLSISDLAINDSLTLNKKAVAAMFGAPAFMLGVGEYKRDEWNQFIQTRIMGLAKLLMQELTQKLIIRESWYLQMNVWSFLDYDIKSVSDVLLAGSDRGFVNGDEWRDRMNLPPAGLKEYRVLENYIPWDMAGQQKKLVGGDE